MESCDGCTKLKDYANANKYLMKNNEELEIEVEHLQAQIEALHTQISDLKQRIPLTRYGYGGMTSIL